MLRYAIGSSIIERGDPLPRERGAKAARLRRDEAALQVASMSCESIFGPCCGEGLPAAFLRRGALASIQRLPGREGGATGPLGGRTEEG